MYINVLWLCATISQAHFILIKVVIRWKVAELVSALEAELVITKEISKESLSESEDNVVRNITMEEKGRHLMFEGKMAIVMLLNEKEISSVPLLQKLLCDENFVKVLNLFCLFVYYIYIFFYGKAPFEQIYME